MEAAPSGVSEHRVGLNHRTFLQDGGAGVSAEPITFHTQCSDTRRMGFVLEVTRG